MERSIAQHHDRRAKVGAAILDYIAHEERRTRDNPAERAKLAAALRPVRDRLVTMYGKTDPFGAEGRRG